MKVIYYEQSLIIYIKCFIQELHMFTKLCLEYKITILLFYLKITILYYLLPIKYTKKFNLQSSFLYLIFILYTLQFYNSK